MDAANIITYPRTKRVAKELSDSSDAVEETAEESPPSGNYKRQQQPTESPTSKRPKAVSKEGRGSASKAKLKAKVKKPPQPKLTKGEEDRQHIESINVSCLCG
jgi:hypothetical protein